MTRSARSSLPAAVVRTTPATLHTDFPKKCWGQVPPLAPALACMLSAMTQAFTGAATPERPKDVLLPPPAPRPAKPEARMQVLALLEHGKTGMAQRSRTSVSATQAKQQPYAGLRPSPPLYALLD